MKKALSFVLSIIFSLGVFSYSDFAFAKTEKLADDINPFYANCTDELPESNRMLPYTLNSSSSYVESKTVFTDYKSAAMFLRDCMVKRISKVTYCISKNPVDNLVNVYNAEVKNTYYPLHGAFSYEISNSDSDGDYLAHCYSGTRNGNRQDMGKYYKLSFNILYRTTLEEEKAVDNYVNAFVNEIKPKKYTRLQLIKAIHDRICSVTDYDYEHYNKGYNRFSHVNTAYSAIKEGFTMCTGYSMLFYKMCSNFNIPVRIVQSENHAWNIVKPIVGKYYYHIDVTWDDGYQFPEDNAPYGCDYYLKCEREILTKKSHRGYLSSENEDHKRINEFANDYFNKTYPISNASFYLNSGGKAMCAYCNTVLDDAKPTSFDHKYSVKTVPPKCHIDGKTVYTCTHCSDTFSERIPALSHSFSDDSVYCLNKCGTVNPDYTALTVKTTKITSVKPNGRTVNLKWKKKSGIKGYQIQYSSNKKFKKKNTFTVNIKKAKVTSKKIKIKIKKKKKIYFRIRTYNSKGKLVKYSDWSKPKVINLK